ncbi:MAG: replication factor C large subunit, partial [Ignisphaera sp.]
NWDLLSYALDMMGPGVAFARKSYKGKFVAFKMPERIKLLAETKKSREYREALAEHLARRLLTSKATVKTDVIPYLRIIFTNNPKYAANIARAYNLPEDLVTWLAGPRAKEIISYLKKPIRKKS